MCAAAVYDVGLQCPAMQALTCATMRALMCTQRNACLDSGYKVFSQFLRDRDTGS